MGQKTDKIFERAKVNLKEDNHENALRLLNEVLNREPSHKEALRGKALIKILKGDEKETEEFLLFAIKQQPEDDQLHQMLGTFYHNQDKPQKALNQFKKAVKLNDSNATVHQGLGLLYANIYGKHKKAIDHYSRTIELGKNNADIFFNRGCSYMLLDRMEEAEQDLRKADKMGHSKANKMIEKYFN
jgi:Tfp pilus assembly protein PilF